MPQSDATTRVTLRLPVELVKRVDEFASRAYCSRTAAVAELLGLGLDGSLAGLESAMAMQSKLKRELESLRVLVATVMRSADTSTGMQVLLSRRRQEIKGGGEASDLFRQARKIGEEFREQIRRDD